jgi:hypothetical protein
MSPSPLTPFFLIILKGALILGAPFSYSMNSEIYCHEFTQYYELKKNPPELKPYNIELLHYEKKLRSVLSESAELVFQSYMEGKVKEGTIEHCIENPKDLDLFMGDVSNVFLEQSLLLLESSPITLHQELAQKTRETQKTNGHLRFKLISHAHLEHYPDKKGGFHRGNGSLFMNFEKIPHSEWIHIFFHELTHAEDPLLSQSIQTYGDPTLLKKVAEIAHQKNNLSAVTEEEKETIYLFLKSGLHRGFLSEVRAWTLTFLSYQKSRDLGLSKEIPWIEKILNTFDQSKNLQNQEIFELEVLKFLSPHFYNPEKKGIYARPLIIEALLKLREEYFQGTRSAFEL